MKEESTKEEPIKDETGKDISAEEKIKTAAFKIFQQKGFAGTRTRDIAEEAGINLALLNYYYRSKEKLFEIIMAESLKQLFSKLVGILNNPTTSLSEKIDTTVNLYIDLLKKNPNIPLFIMSEIQANPDKFRKLVGIPDLSIPDVVAVKQIKEQMEIGGIVDIDPFHIILNMISMTIFPFAAKPLVKILNKKNDEEYDQFIEERRKLIPIWIKSMLVPANK